MAIDYNTNTEIICEEPIPVGIAIKKTVGFLNQVYQRYQGETVKDASKQMDDLMSLIANNGKVCDFDRCKADVGNTGPDATLNLNAYFWSGSYTYSVPGCKLKPATSNPCPDLANSADSLAKTAAALSSQADNIHALFGSKNEVVPKGLEQSGEVAGETKISDVDLVRRYIDNVDKFWLTPNPQGNTCALSELDRARISQGKMGEKYPMQCLDALSKDMYTIKAWSPECEKECATFSQGCKDCLAKCEGESVYATLNCKIYSDSFNDKCAPFKDVAGPFQCCGKYCADGFNSQCKECLCEGLTQEECLDWICGGSKANWVCCHEEPIQNPQWYSYDQIFATVDVMETVFVPGQGVTHRIVAREDRFGVVYENMREAYEYFSDIDLALLMANTYKESSFKNQAGGCNVNSGDNIAIKTEDKNALRVIIDDLAKVGVNLDFNTVPLSCRGNDLHGGAMGPAQFMPSTWLDYKDRVTKITKATEANPWVEVDAYVAEALKLSDLKKLKGSEEEAVAHYMGDVSNDDIRVKKVFCMQKIFKNQIDNGCFEETSKTNKNPACNVNLDDFINKQVKENLNGCIEGKFIAKKGLFDFLAFLTFWK
ncbi:MAG: hypothetical protein PHY72_03425 [Candidatus Pacebacteria bacterium]|nr:hypothetical protein [Candidatus Paceibacterota bacterium]